ncbi:WD40 repeat-like protein [Tothia fuscella]|uniref:Mitochondrial division protein 1 n=1 Tax=Tothia fuscella TaxID=1048955 RepID=A0A9P4NH50_9PEZI|nr:WD40 repeat-like protein [Tothia fuscella]
MSRSTDAGHFFQTTAALDETARKIRKAKNKLGNPIRLPSKILAIAADPYNASCVYVAEAAGTVKRVVLETGDIAQVFRPKTNLLAPLTCLAVSTASREGAYGTLFAGSWDKNIYCWPLVKNGIKAPKQLSGHSDFIKALISLNLGDTEILVSASSDASIIVWDVKAGTKLHTLKGHSRGVTALALESLSLDEGLPFATIFSGDSNREIRRWHISIAASHELPTESNEETIPGGPFAPLLAHETSIYALRFDSDGDLWTASADKSAQCIVRERAWAVDTTLTHPDFVRDVVVDENGGWVVTACRDEEVRVWERGSGKLFHTFSGHYEEVTGLLLLADLVVSVSIDGTVRQWSLKKADLVKAIEEAAKPPLEEEEGEEEEKPKGSGMTEEEERELAELMESD